MIVSTTDRLEDRPVQEYLGVVTGEALTAAKVVKGVGDTIRGAGGKRAGAFEDALRRARREAIREMCSQAQDRGANAVVGVAVEFQVLGRRKKGVLVSAVGTAVRVD